MEIRIHVENIDYGSLAAVLLPKIGDRIRDSSNPILRLLLSKADDAEFVRNTVNSFPQRIKDEFTVMLLNKNEEKMIENLTGLGASNGISFDIKSVKAEM